MTKQRRERPLGERDTLTETLARFRQDLSLYCAAALRIRTKDATIVPFEMNNAQRIVQARITAQLKRLGKVRLIILKARQEGISTLVAARFFRTAHLFPGTVSLVVADELGRAEKLFQIYERYYDNLPAEIKPRKKQTARGRYLSFYHDSEIGVRPASDKQAGRATTIHRLHASELAYWGGTARTTWVSLMQAVPQGSGEVIVESTANGAGGLFHELWELAESGKSDWEAIFLPWWIHEEYEIETTPDIEAWIMSTLDDFERVATGEGIPYQGALHVLPITKLAWRRAVIAENFGTVIGEVPSPAAVRSFQVEYPATAEEAFLTSGSCFFDEDILRRMTLRVSEPILTGRLVRINETESFRVDPNTRGPVYVWAEPDPDAHYVIGVDTAEGRLATATRSARNPGGEADEEDRDFSAAIVLELPTKDHGARVVAEIHGRLAPEVFTEQLVKLGEWYSCGGGTTGFYRNKALIAVESNHSSGQTVLRLLKEHYRYAPLYWQRETNRRTKKVGRRLGWRTDEVTRMIMLDDAGRIVRQESVEIPSRQLLKEMITFIVWPNGKPAANDGCHDDRVIGFAIAGQMMAEHRHSIDSPLPEYTPDPDTQTG